MKRSVECVDGVAGAEARKPPRRYQRRQAYTPKSLARVNPGSAVAHEQCLMILSVLSGQRTVSEVIEAAKMPRNVYYRMEDRALAGMMAGLDPAQSSVHSDSFELRHARREIRVLTAQVKSLTQRKRAAERLLRMVLKSGRAAMRVSRRTRAPKRIVPSMTPGADLR